MEGTFLGHQEGLSMKTQCPHCAKQFQTNEAYVGKRTICKGCGQKFEITDMESVSASQGGGDLFAMFAQAESSSAAVEAPPRPAPPRIRKGPQPSTLPGGAVPPLPSPGRASVPRKRKPGDYPIWGKPIFLIVGPPGVGLWLFLANAAVLAVGWNNFPVWGFGMAGVVAFLMTSSVWWRIRAGQNGMSILKSMFIPLYPLFFTLDNWAAMREPAICHLRAWALLGFCLLVGYKSGFMKPQPDSTGPSVQTNIPAEMYHVGNDPFPARSTPRPNR